MIWTDDIEAENPREQGEPGTMARILRIEFRILAEGESTPEAEGVLRLPWPDGKTLEDVTLAHFEKTCRHYHHQKGRIRPTHSTYGY